MIKTLQKARMLGSLLTVLLLAAALSGKAMASKEITITNGQTLYESLVFAINDQNKTTPLSGIEFSSIGNLIGYTDAALGQYRLMRRCKNDKMPSLSRIQSWLLIKNWMEKNPSQWNLPPWFIINMAYNESWPCTPL